MFSRNTYEYALRDFREEAGLDNNLSAEDAVSEDVVHTLSNSISKLAEESSPKDGVRITIVVEGIDYEEERREEGLDRGFAR